MGSSHNNLQWMNSPFGDTTFTKVFVGGLAWETASHGLRRHFEQFGDILEAVVISDKNTGRSKGYGFVTFRDAESARRACADPNPIIDGRRANCNLASLRSSQSLPSMPFGPPRAQMPPHGSTPFPRIRYSGSPGYHQLVPYIQPRFVYSPYGYAPYGSEYVYPQGVYNPQMNQQYIQVYGVPGTVQPGANPRGLSGHPLPGIYGYPPIQGFGVPDHVMQFGGVDNRTTTAIIPTVQAPYPSGVGTPDAGQTQIVVTSHSPQFTSSSDQTTS